MSDEDLCPFSRVIVGKWLPCPHARLLERPSGKLRCSRADDYRDSCLNLDAVLKENSRFALGIRNLDQALTHAQLMKIRCGGLLGMQRVMKQSGDECIDIVSLVQAILTHYGVFENFPFSEILNDIRQFRFR